MNSLSTKQILCFLFCAFLTLSGCTHTTRDTGTPGISPENHEMKTIGIIGGVSWVSSIEYYRLMNERVQKELGGLHSAKVLLYSIEFGNFSKEERLAEQGNWNPLRKTMINAGERLERGGADCILIASNTMNSTADLIQAHVSIPVINIIDATAQQIQKKGLHTVALLGTKYTMEQDFYKGRLHEKYGLKVVTPTKEEREYINKVIFDELCAEKILNPARKHFLTIIDRLIHDEGAEGVILGCTEIPLLIHQDDVPVPVFDTMKIHVDAAIDFALR